MQLQQYNHERHGIKNSLCVDTWNPLKVMSALCEVLFESAIWGTTNLPQAYENVSGPPITDASIVMSLPDFPSPLYVSLKSVTDQSM